MLRPFGAVDWKADVWVNDVKVGSHTGGYVPFSFDITQALKAGENTLTVRVWDPTDRGYQPRGKQVCNPDGIWYTPVSGIWQTVWIEPVAGPFFAIQSSCLGAPRQTNTASARESAMACTTGPSSLK